MQLTPYLYFKGECEGALNFYEACGLGQDRGVAPLRWLADGGAGGRAHGATRSCIKDLVAEGRL